MPLDLPLLPLLGRRSTKGRDDPTRAGLCVTWHGKVVPAVTELVRIGGVSTAVEVPEFAEPELRQIVAALTAIDRFENAADIAPEHLLELAAGLYIRHGGTVATWRKYETSLGVTRSKTKQPASPLQPFLRWARGGKPDITGLLHQLSATLDDWVELGDKRPDPTPRGGSGTSVFAGWLRRHSGYTNVALGSRYARGGYLGIASTGNPEWYAPESVFRAMGCRFDLDVASPGQVTVWWIPADRHFTAANNGLERPWGDAFVWCNPPFSREGLPLWMEKFRRHGNGVAMIGDRTSTEAWQNVCGNADLILFTNKKINFISPNSSPGNNTLGSTLIAYGERGVEALRNAAAAGLGILFTPCPVLTSEDRRVENSRQGEIPRVTGQPILPEKRDLTPKVVIENYRVDWKRLTDAEKAEYGSFAEFCEAAWSVDRDTFDPEGDYPVLPRELIEEVNNRG